MRHRGKEQELINIMFQCVLLRHDPNYREHFDAMTQEQMAEWVAHQLRECGFPTSPCGASWGVLDNE